MSKVMSKNIVPYSGAKLTHYPSCGFFFPCTETNLTPKDYITDTVSGIQYQPSNEIFSEGQVPYGTVSNVQGLSSAVYLDGGTPNCVLKRGTWPNLGLKTVINFAVGRVMHAAARIPIGNGTGLDDDLTVSWGGGMHALAMNTSLQASTGVAPLRALPATGTDVIVVVEYQPETVLMAKATDLNGNTFGLAVDGTETKQSVTPIAVGPINPGLNNKSRVGGLALYGWACFIFDGALPADREVAYQWMANSWAAGHRYLWPGWELL